MFTIYNVLDICHYIISYSNDKEYGISNLKLQKILYFIQAYFLLTGNRPCFNEKIEAWDFGPVVSEAYKMYAAYGSNDIPSSDSYLSYNENDWWSTDRIEYDDVIDSYDKDLISDVVNRFSNYSATDLNQIIFKQTPWVVANLNNNQEITHESLIGYFNN